MCALLIVILGFFAAADEAPRPLLELGLGGGSGYSPDYPGADQSRFHHIAFPVFYYHGRIFRADREDGTRARVVNKPVWAVDVSGSGAFPIESKDNRAREGMDDLDWLGEFGPRLYVRLENTHDFVMRAYVLARGAFTTDFAFTKARGLVFGVGLSIEKKHFLKQELTLYSRITPQAATQEYHDYFYSVPDAYQTANREAYNAKAGYLGTWSSLGIAYESPRFLATTGVAFITTEGSANEASPLYKSDSNVAAFIGLAWFFYHSEERGYL